MLFELQNIFRQDCLLNSTRILIVGVSGGPDSVCLLDSLHRSGYSLVVAHLNHQLRPESIEDARYVEHLASQFGIPCVVVSADVKGYAESHSLSIEEAARFLRYQFLFREASNSNAQAVVVGHTADDQVETVLMHWLRGAGIEGLRGMPIRQLPSAWSDSIPLVRPLLKFHRSEILLYCQQNDLHPVIDKSNMDPTFYRNRLRHELIPFLKTYNLGIEENILHLADILRHDEVILERVVSSAWKKCVARQGSGYVAFHRSILKEQDLGLQRRLIRKAFSLHRPGLRDISYKIIERATNFLRHPPTTPQLDLAAGVRMFDEAELTWLATWEADLPADDWPQVSQESVIQEEGNSSGLLMAGWQIIKIEVHDFVEPFQKFMENPDPYQAWLDADLLAQSLQVRSRRPGDRFQPLGMVEGSMKISDYMMNVKLPRRARASWPLVCSLKQIVWLPGFTIHQAFRITSETKHAILLRLIRKA